MHVQRSRIRSSLQRIDPRGVRNRFHATLYRRQYCFRCLTVYGILMVTTNLFDGDL